MTIRETFEWVALPAGRAPGPDGACRVSVFIAPQVTLADEPERVLRLDELVALVDWPATLAAISFDVEFEGTEPVAATRVGRGPDSTLWRSLFPGDTRVIPFVPDDPSTHTVVGFSTMDMVETIEAGYADAAPLEPPPVDQFDPGFWDPGHWMPEPAEPDESFEPEPDAPWLVGNLFPSIVNVVAQPGNAWLEGMAVDASNLLPHAMFIGGARNDVLLGDGEPMRGTADLEASRFAEAMRLRWIPLEPLEPVGVEPGLAAPQADPEQALRDNYDLHRIVAALGDHAAMLRALGLVVDLEVPSVPPASGRMRVHPRRDGDGEGEGGGGGAAAADRTPWIAVTDAGPQRFAAASATDDETPPGLESLARYRVVQLDVEAAGAQLLDAAASELAGIGAPAGLPSLRTVGLRLAELEAASHLMERGARMNEVRAGEAADAVEPGSAEMTLDADDVQRGVRMDVFDAASGHWHSLHARTTTFTTDAGATLGPIVGEGSVAGSFTGRPMAPGESLPPGEIVQVDETLVTWTGWSLATPRPGGAISADPMMTDVVHREEHGGELVGRPENTAMTSAGLRIDTAPLEGSLPRLRFGREYRVRLRSVDLAGNALTVVEADAATAEATSGAGVGAAAVSGPIVFRRFEPVLPPVPAFVDDPDAAGFARHGESERRLVVRSGLDAGDATFGPEPGVTERLLFAPNCSVTLAEWHGVFDEAFGRDATDAARERAYDRAARESGTLTPGARELPWLADPGSAGVCLTGLPGVAADATVTVPWPSTPVGPGPIRLRVIALDVDVPRPPAVDEETGLIEVFMPPGARAAVEVSSMLADTRIMAVPANWRARLAGDPLAEAEAKLARHRHPLVTPSLPLEFMHATQRPFMTPAPAEPPRLLARAADDTQTQLHIPWSVHAPSTATLELVAEWTVPLDEPVPAGSPRALGPDGDGADGGAGAHAGARFVPAAAAILAELGAQTLVAVPAPGEPTVRSVVVVDRPTVTEDGEADAGPRGGGGFASVDLDTTGHVRLRVRAVATSRFGEFFPPEYGPAAASGEGPERPSRLTRESAVIVFDVPSTRRPPAPTVVDVLPLVVRHVDAGGARREGGWLRVWFARPWFASGWDEFPAVLAGRHVQPRFPGASDWLVSTLVAPDPARQVPVFLGATAEALGGFPDDWVDVKLLEMAESDASGGPVTALADRRIDWDPDREAWFTDLRVDVPGLYFPFVRLALAADQPHSIAGATEHAVRVSPIATPDPVQVLPDRELQHHVEPNGVLIEIVGRSYELSLGPVNVGSEEFPEWSMEPLNAPSRARVVVQRRVRSGGDELLAWEDEFEQALISAPEAPPGLLAASAMLPFDPTNPPGEFRAVVIEEDFAFGPKISSAPEETRPRVTYLEIVPLPRAVALGV